MIFCGETLETSGPYIYTCFLSSQFPEVKTMSNWNPWGSSEEEVTLAGVLEMPGLVNQEESRGSFGYKNVRFTFLGPKIKQTRAESWLLHLRQVLLIQFAFHK